MPITCSAIVLVLFLCGVTCGLSAGVWLVCFLAAGSYVAAFIWLCRKKAWKKFFANFFTPGFCALAVLFGIFCYLNYGRVAFNWDEFSHWADIVKVMFTLNDFGTNPLSYSTFWSYPPGISLFQYFLQELQGWFHAGNFSEWHLYLAYQIFALSYMVPFLKGVSFKKPFIFLTLVALFVFSPLFVYTDFYNAILVDPILGILTGTGFAAIYLTKHKDVIYHLWIASILSMLVLIKDVGLLLAIFLGAAYVIDRFPKRTPENTDKRFYNMPWFGILAAASAIMLPKLIWTIHLKICRPSKSQKYDVGSVVRAVLGQDTGWKRTTWVRYFRAFIGQGISIGNTGITVNYCVLLFLLMGMLAVLFLFYEKRDNAYVSKGKLLFSCLGAESVVYVVGLCLLYMAGFSEYEATHLASFDRYLGIAYLAVWTTVVMLAGGVLREKEALSPALPTMALALMLAVIPLRSVLDFAGRNYVDYSKEWREPLGPICDAINQIPETSHIYFICQESSGYEFWVTRYTVRPHFVDGNWSIGEPFYEGDVWTSTTTAEEWRELLVESYDYVALYKINDYFIENFASVFEEADDICENCVYKVNKETGLLEKFGG